MAQNQHFFVTLDKQVIQTQLVQVLAIVKVQVSVIRSVHRLANQFRLA